MPKITMVLTDRDTENAQAVHTATSARSKAHAVSIALSLARFLVDARRRGARIMLEERDGETHVVVMPELENLGSQP